MPLGGTEVNSGYKGYGLGMLVEIFCGILSGLYTVKAPISGIHGSTTNVRLWQVSL